MKKNIKKTKNIKYLILPIFLLALTFNFSKKANAATGCCFKDQMTAISLCAANIAESDCNKTNYGPNPYIIPASPNCNETEIARSVCKTSLIDTKAAVDDAEKAAKAEEAAKAAANKVDENGCTTGGTGTINFTNPLKFCTVEKILTSALGTLQGIILTLSIIFIVLGGIFYITSAGNEKRITAAKGTLTAAVIGLAIGIAAPSFLKEISTILGWNSAPSEVAGAVSLSKILLNVLNFLLSIAGIIALIMLIIGGIGYVTSAGDENRIEGSKKIFLYSIIGITLTLAAMVIVRQIANFFI